MKILRCCGRGSRVVMVLVVWAMLLAMLQIIVSKSERGIKLLNRERARSSLMESSGRKVALVDKCAKEFLADGTLHLVQTEAGGNRLRIYDRHGKMLWQGAASALPYTYLKWTEAEGRNHYCISRQFLQGAQSITPEFSRDLKIIVGNDGNGGVIWRYSASQRFFCGYAFNGDGRGYIGADGYHQNRQKVLPFGPFENFIYRNDQSHPRFENSSYRFFQRVVPVLLWQTRHRLYEINFAAHQVKLLLDLPQQRLLQIQVANWNPQQSAGRSSAQIHCLAGFGKHYLLSPGGKVTELTLPAKFAKTTIRASITDRGLFLYRQGEQSYRPLPSKTFFWVNDYQPRQWVALYKIATNGQPVLLSRLEWQPSNDQPIDLATSYYLRLVSPPVYDPIWRICDNACQSCWADRRQLLESATLAFGHVRPHHSVANWLVSGLLLAAMLWHANSRRSGWYNVALWGVVVVAFNLVGLLTYLALKHSPLICCPICNKPRGLESPGCPHCLTVLPSPKIERPVIIPMNKSLSVI